MKTATRATPRSRQTVETETDGSEIVIDFPQRKDVVVSREYTFRIGASPEISDLEISVDDSEWTACRPAVGFWWYDWAGYPAGKHQAMARGRRPDGSFVVTALRRFEAELPAPDAAGDGFAE